MANSNVIEISSEHAEVAAARYDQHPLRLVQLENVLVRPAADTIDQVLSSQAEFGPIYGLYKRAEPLVDHATWSSADEKHRFFHYEKLSGFQPGCDTTNLQTFFKVRQYLSSDTFCDLARTVTGENLLPVESATVQRLRQGHYLRAHHDQQNDRKVAFILYLSPDWDPAYGGQLTIKGREGEVARVEPLYNSLVLFDVAHHRHHYIEPLTTQAGDRARNTISGWMSC